VVAGGFAYHSSGKTPAGKDLSPVRRVMENFMALNVVPVSKAAAREEHEWPETGNTDDEHGQHSGLRHRPRRSRHVVVRIARDETHHEKEEDGTYKARAGLRGSRQ
jgi:hypothetical protein